jgi:hypothetical protein
VLQKQYGAAVQVMKNALREDSTVAAYRGFIGRLDDVVQIDQRP